MILGFFCTNYKLPDQPLRRNPGAKSLKTNLWKSSLSRIWAKLIAAIVEQNLWMKSLNTIFEKSLKQYLSKLFDQSIWTNRWTNIEKTCWTKSLQNMWTKSLEGPLERNRLESNLWTKSLKKNLWKHLSRLADLNKVMRVSWSSGSDRSKIFESQQFLQAWLGLNFAPLYADH